MRQYLIFMFLLLFLAQAAFAQPTLIYNDIIEKKYERFKKEYAADYKQKMQVIKNEKSSCPTPPQGYSRDPHSDCNHSQDDYQRCWCTEEKDRESRLEKLTKDYAAVYRRLEYEKQEEYKRLEAEQKQQKETGNQNLSTYNNITFKRLKPDNPEKLKADEFYYFGVINVPISKGVLHVFSVPIYHKGDTKDNLRLEVLTFNTEGLNAILETEAKKLLVEELKPQGRTVTENQIEKRANELLGQIKNEQIDRVSIFTGTPNNNYPAKTLEQSQNQIKETISTMQETINSIDLGDSEKNLYRYVILERQTVQELKFPAATKTTTSKNH